MSRQCALEAEDRRWDNGAIMQEGMEVANKGLSKIRGSNSKMVVEPTRDQFADETPYRLYA